MADQIEIDYPLLGDLALKTAASAGRGCWTLGCETLDRDYADFDAYKGYIPQLAVGTLRFQAGWAKTEKRPGVYDFDWLDALVDSAISSMNSPVMSRLLQMFRKEKSQADIQTTRNNSFL